MASSLGSYGGGQTIAVDGATVHLAYTATRGGPGAGDTMYRRSTDHGATWSPAVFIGEASANSDRQARVQLEADSGRVFASWQREASVSGGALLADRLGYNTSEDGGVTWSTARILPFHTGVDRNHQQTWMTPGGDVYLIWRHGDTADDPTGYLYSSDYGQTGRHRSSPSIPPMPPTIRTRWSPALSACMCSSGRWGPCSTPTVRWGVQ